MLTKSCLCPEPFQWQVSQSNCTQEAKYVLKYSKTHKYAFYGYNELTFSQLGYARIGLPNT